MPIHKKGSKKIPNNYRPVSLTSIIIMVKLLESILRDQIMNHLVNNNLISESQYGLLPVKSCTLQLLEMMNDWISLIDQRISIDVLYTDLRKAFDTVPHRRLLHKITSFGITVKVYEWIKAFLADRR